MFVYLCDGRVIEVARVTAVKVDHVALVLYDGNTVAGRFNLRDVYFSSKVKTSPIPA
jgi:hypothetical protein